MLRLWPNQALRCSQARCRRKLAPRQDVCAEQKVFMFNWNVHLRKHPVHADWQARFILLVFLACMRACGILPPCFPCMHLK